MVLFSFIPCLPHHKNVLLFSFGFLEHPEDQWPIWVTPPENIKTAFNIVSDMLLTGYDAPIASVLYLDKPLKEHNLLQALARVNRSRKGKHAGFIVDYNGISAYLIQAMEISLGI